MFFDELRECNLIRKNGKYTLGRDDFDHLFGINDVMVLTPDQEDIAHLGNVTFLFGLLGIYIKSFTSVASGFIANYQSNDFNGTFLINSYEDYIKRILSDECIKRKNLSDLYEYILSLLNRGYSLEKISLLVSICINNDDSLKLDSNINKLSESFDNANQQNCHDNHYVLCQIIFNREDYANDLNLLKDLDDQSEIDKMIHENAKNKYNMDQLEEKKYRKKMLISISLYKKVLFKYILPGYLTYRGRDRDNNKIAQDSQILNNVDRIKSLMDLLKVNLNESNYSLYEAATLILNMCSTDYSADMAYDYLQRIVSYDGEIIDANYIGIIEEGIPKTPNNQIDKQETRHIINR